MTIDEETKQAAFMAYPENISYSTIGDAMYDYNAEPRRIWLAGVQWAYAHPKKVELTIDEIEQAAKEIIDKDWEKQQEIIWEYIRRQLKYVIINEACDWLRTYAECFHNDTTEEFCLDEMIESFKEAMWKNA